MNTITSTTKVLPDTTHVKSADQTTVRIPDKKTTNNKEVTVMNGYTTLLHRKFSRIELLSYHTHKDGCYATAYGNDEQIPIENVDGDDLMHYVLGLEHSFIFPKAPVVRLIRAWDENDNLVQGWDNFLKHLGIKVNLVSKVIDTTDDPFMETLMDGVATSGWDGPGLVRVWVAMQGVSIGVGSNKEMVEVAALGHLMGQFDIALENLIDAVNGGSKGDTDILKASKYIGRVFAPARYFTENKMTIEIVDREVDVTIDGLTGYVDRKWLRRETGLHAPVNARLAGTVLDDRGMAKGHYFVADLENGVDLLMLGDQFKKQIMSDGTYWAAFEELHEIDRVYLDIQSLINLREVFDNKTVMMWAKRMLKAVATDLKAGVLPAAIGDLTALMRSGYDFTNYERWILRKMALRGIGVLTPLLARRVWTFFRSWVEKIDNLRVEIPGAVRRYVTPDLNDRVRPGHIIIEGASFFISKSDADWLHRLHGGSDHDDGFVLIPLTGNRVMLYRNPNQCGEWSILKIQDTDHIFSEPLALVLPKSQRNNARTVEQTPEEIMDTIRKFWDFIKAEKIKVETCLQYRVPERIRDDVRYIDGPLTDLYGDLRAYLRLCDVNFKEWTKNMPIPEELTMYKDAWYNVASQLRVDYGAGVQDIRRRTDNAAALAKKEQREFDREAYSRRLFDRLHASTRKEFARYTADEQKLIVRNLMHYCYVTQVGKVTRGGYMLTQNNDGILGVPSSLTGKSIGIVDVLLDLLPELGFGTSVEVVELESFHYTDQGMVAITADGKGWDEMHISPQQVVVRRTPEPREYDTRGLAVIGYGFWAQLAEEEGITDPSDRDINVLIARAQQRIAELKEITVKHGDFFDGDQRLGRMGGKSRLDDGIYTLLSVGRPAPA